MNSIQRGIGAGAFRVSWIAAATSILIGIAMVYVPYEFGAPIFRHLYGSLRLLGAGFLTGGLLVALASLYPEWPRVIGLLGKLLLTIATSAYVWHASIRVGAWTGAVAYPLLIGTLWIEALPSFRRRRIGLFVPYLALTALGIGSLMLLIPSQFPASVYAHLTPVIGPTGVTFAVSGLVLLWAHLRDRHRLRTGLLLALTVPFSYLMISLALAKSWSGAQFYGAVVSGAVLCVFADRLQLASSLRYRVWRGMILAACVPLMGLGALATVLMQYAVERQAKDEVRRAVTARVETLQQVLALARDALSAHAALPHFAQAVRTNDQEAVKRSLELLQLHESGLAGLFVVSTEGRVLARSRPDVPRSRDFIDTPLLTEGLGATESFVSRPWRGLGGRAWIGVAAPVRFEGELVGLLVGAQALDSLSLIDERTGVRFGVQVFDVRDRLLLRDAMNSEALTPIALPTDVVDQITSGAEGSFDGLDGTHRQVLLAWARVPGTPWVVLAQQQVQDAYALVTQLGAGAVFLVTLAALLSLLLSQITASEVTRRVRGVRDAADGLARGDLARRVETVGNDELTRLGASFNAMADQIESAHAELERTNEELRSAVAIRDEFLSLASHELRTPLTPLKMGAQLLRGWFDGPGEMDRERVGRTLERMDRQTERLSTLISDMLDISRIQAGRFALEPKRFDLAALTTEVVDRVRFSQLSGTHRIELDVPRGAMDGEWDPGRLEQVIMNLLENAIRYSPEGGRIRVSLSEDDGRVRLEVEDEGIGIPPDSLPQLFQPFFRASNATARHYGGLGLGLHICREIVERHGGTIRAESAGERRGSRFTVELPRNPVPLAASASA